ncbi:hypothetical protein EON83_26885 [bacterium]|nr:MAG: hypothetical protein EON83_26885 [bacterium]
MADWQLLLDSLKSSAYEYAYFVDGEEAALLPSLPVVFKKDVGCRLAVTIDSILLNCHFFHPSEIEFDIDPREIKKQHDAEQIFGFMKYIGCLLNKEVILTPENDQAVLLFRFAPDVGEVQYIPPPSSQ